MKLSCFSVFFVCVTSFLLFCSYYLLIFYIISFSSTGIRVWFAIIVLCRQMLLSMFFFFPFMTEFCGFFVNVNFCFAFLHKAKILRHKSALNVYNVSFFRHMLFYAK